MTSASHLTPSTPARRGQAGDVWIEYMLIVAFFGLPVAAGCIRLGPPLMRLYWFSQLALAGPFP